jgi:hypothetical protein
MISQWPLSHLGAGTHDPFIQYRSKKRRVNKTYEILAGD